MISCSAWGKAGDKSIAHSALVEAVAQLTKALEQIASVPGTPALRAKQIKLQLALASVLMHVKGYTSPEGPAAFEAAGALMDRAESMGEHPDDPLLRFSVLYGQWAAYYVAMNLHMLLPLSKEFLARAEKEAATTPLLIGNRLMGVSCLMLGDLETARTYFDNAVALYAPAEHRPLAARFLQDVGCMALAYRSIASWALGYPDVALKDADALLNNAREVGQVGTTMYTLMHVCFPELLAGRIAAAQAHAQELIALAEDKGTPLWLGYGLTLRGWAWLLGGRDAEACESIMAGFDVCTSIGSKAFNSLFLIALARAHAQLGRLDEARGCISKALEHIETTGDRWAEAEVYRTAGEIVLATPDRNLEQAELSFQRSLAIARSQKAKSWELRTASSLARLWRDQGRREEARETLGAIYGSFTEGFETPDLQQAKGLLVELDG
jgi:predicted ATPase